MNDKIKTPHYEDDVFLAYIDEELEANEAAQLESHLRDCPQCRKEFLDIARLAGFTSSNLSFTASVSAKQARIGAAKRGIWQKSGVAAAILVLLAAGGSLGSQHVRTALAAILQTFTINQVQAVQVSAKDLRNVDNILTQNGKVNLSTYGSVTTKQVMQPASVPLDQVSAKSGLPNDWPTALAGATNLQAVVTSAGQATFLLHVNAINDLLKQEGATQLFPQSLDNAPITVTIPAVANISGGGYQLDEARVPTLSVPGTISVTAVKNAFLSIPFLPSSLSQAISSIGNWRQTLIVPTSGQVTNLQFQGHSAFLTADALPGDDTLVWIANGVIHAFSGPVPQGGQSAFINQANQWFS